MLKNKKFSSFENQQSLTENFRKFLKEEESILSERFFDGQTKSTIVSKDWVETIAKRIEDKIDGITTGLDLIRTRQFLTSLHGKFTQDEETGEYVPAIFHAMRWISRAFAGTSPGLMKVNRKNAESWKTFDKFMATEFAIDSNRPDQRRVQEILRFLRKEKFYETAEEAEAANREGAKKLDFKTAMRLNKIPKHIKLLDASGNIVVPNEKHTAEVFRAYRSPMTRKNKKKLYGSLIGDDDEKYFALLLLQTMGGDVESVTTDDLPWQPDERDINHGNYDAEERAQRLAGEPMNEHQIFAGSSKSKKTLLSEFAFDIEDVEAAAAGTPAAPAAGTPAAPAAGTPAVGAAPAAAAAVEPESELKRKAKKMGISPEKLLKKRGHAKKSYKKIAQMIKDKTGEEIPAHYKHIDKYAIEKLGLKAGKGGFTNFDQMYDQIEASLSTGGADTEPSGKAVMPTSGEFEDTQKLKLRDPEDAGLQGAAVPKAADAERARRIAQTKKDFAYTPPEGAHEKWRDIQRKQAEKNRPLGKKVDRFIDKTFQQGSLKGQEILDKAKTIPKRLKKAADQAAIDAQDGDYNNVLSPRERRTNAGSFQESLRETIAQQLRSEPKFQYLFEDSVESKVVDIIIENLMKYDYFRKLALTSSKKPVK